MPNKNTLRVNDLHAGLRRGTREVGQEVYTLVLNRILAQQLPLGVCMQNEAVER
jgi:hypothetical protein